MDANKHSADGNMTIKVNLAQRVQTELGQNVYLCYQCAKCSSGCPLVDYFDWQPNQILRAVQLGQEDIALGSQTPWLCASCQTCSTRCPQNLDLAEIMAFLTREASDRGIPPSVPEVNIFHEAFLREVGLWGRAYELGLKAEINLRSRNLLADLDLAAKLIRKNKVSVLPHRARRPRQVKPIPTADQAVAYYPGCSLESTAQEFNASAKAVCHALGINLIEPEGWVCCGSTSAHVQDPEAAVRLPMLNLGLIEQSGFREVTMPCAACFNRHKTAEHEFASDPKTRQEVNSANGYVYQGTVKVRSLMEVLHRQIGAAKIAEKLERPLAELRVVCYYGCLLTRPPQVTGAQKAEDPTELDELVTAVGAEARDWSYKSACCGASLSLSRPDIVINLGSNLIHEARRAGAEAIVVACPLCHANLDARQFQMELEEPMPVLYFTQLLALAMGLPATDAALDKNIVDPRPLLTAKGFLQDT